MGDGSLKVDLVLLSGLVAADKDECTIKLGVDNGILGGNGILSEGGLVYFSFAVSRTLSLFWKINCIHFFLFHRFQRVQRIKVGWFCMLFFLESWPFTKISRSLLNHLH